MDIPATASADLAARARAAWEHAASRFSGYHLLLPGSPSFVCLVDECPARCCRVFSVALNERDVERFARVSGLQPVEFLEVEDGRPVELPLAQPYLLARDDGRCRFLLPEHHCGAYEARPTACRLYPHFVVYWDTAADRAIHRDSPPLETVLSGDSPLVPLLLGHRDCPGFVGPPLGEAAWLSLLRETDHLQRQLA
ncbi:YkgJ family cysteine cluster protein [Tepidiforma sp.]|uniref:YkgJ family cysteine cluster protein n=1 Tax=Tepidiforma sp. TaxID=2682230 RepID=UPI002ADDEC90|nr:YkgJ family cysteine cluster protein [Tepidiforma sp.]